LLNGGLFTRDFLLQGIQDAAAWARLDNAGLVDVRKHLDVLFANFGKLKNPNEAETEKELIWPVLEALGWVDMLVQQNLSAKRRDDVPDALLFPNAEAKQKAMPLSAWQRFQHGVCVVEAKRWARPLDRADARQPGEDGVPSTQMLRYLRRVDDVTNGGLRWGILTSGRHWRLYFRGALSIAEDFLEIDLGKVLGLQGFERDLLDKRPDIFADDDAWSSHVFKLFTVVFGREAFLPDHHGETFHLLALREGKQWEERVARDLSDTVFGQLFPMLGQALADSDGKGGVALAAPFLDELREGALILLYRLLFVLYAEDRNLLPDEIGPYADYSLTRLRLEVAEKKARGTPFPIASKLTGPGLMACSEQSPRVTIISASRPTTAVCSNHQQRRSSPASSCPTASSRKSSSVCRTWTSAVAAHRNTSIIAICPSSSSALCTSASWNMG
jgi:hypothetical protein